MKKIELTKEQIKLIIEKYTTEPIGMAEIGKLYGVSREVIKRILTENNIPLTTPGQKYKGGKIAANKRTYEKNKLNGYNKLNQKKWVEKNKEHREEWCKDWRRKNKEIIKNKKREYQKKLISKNPQYKLAQRFRTAIWQNLKDNGTTKYKSTFDLLPYTFNELKEHLESLFLEGMTWDNYGLWHVDHAIPQTYFKYETTDSDDFIKCWSLGNLKPIWGEINMSKNNTIKYLSLDSIDTLLENDKVDLSGVGFEDILIAKEYLHSIIQHHGKEYLAQYVDKILKLIWKISPTLPKITTNENYTGLLKYINNVKPLDSDGNIVNAKVNSYGNSLLKSKFNSYWKTKYKINKSPAEAWLSENDMLVVLKYRLGLNNSGEIFNISLKEMIKGLSATRKTVSFFKPLLASFLYKKYLNDTPAPIVIDPCCGFGGRLLGFKSTYPDGTYIGCEPNTETYAELLELSKNFTNVFIYNCKFEDFTTPDEYDLVFTSIPYYDLEIYSEHQTYKSFDDWHNVFIKKILSLKNVVLNMDMSTCNRLGLAEHTKYHLINNKTHFTKTNNSECFIELGFNKNGTQ